MNDDSEACISLHCAAVAAPASQVCIKPNAIRIPNDDSTHIYTKSGGRDSGERG